MKKTFWRAFVILLVLAFVASACAPAPAPEPAPAAEEKPAQEEPAAEKPAEPAEPAEAAPPAEASVINIIHYYSGELGKKGMTELFDSFGKADPKFKVVDNTTGHEDFKTQILVMLAGENPPDIFSYWAGARTQFVVDSNRLLELDSFWTDNRLDDIIPSGVKPAAIYNGKIFAIPQNVHITGFWYNPKVFEKAGVKPPANWDEFLAACEAIKASGAAPIALGSKNRWPAQYWFDYTLAYTAGIDFRQEVMAGTAPYTDPKVEKAMETWKMLVDKGYFHKDANAYDWNDAADQVANGEAGMTLMGTWIAGYWDGKGLKPEVDYDFFPFPVIDASLPVTTHGTVDAWVIPSGSKNVEGSEALVLHMLKPDNQALWAKAQGALAAVNNVPADTYNPVQKKAADYLNKALFYSGYDLSTTPPMAEGGLDMFAKFMDDPAGYKDFLKQTEDVAIDVFKK